MNTVPVNTRNTPTPEEEVERTRDEQYYRPPVDILETEEGLVMKIDLPGANREQIEVRFEDNELTIFAPIAERQSAETKYLLQEYRVGDYYRKFRVGEMIDASKIRAEYQLGVLSLYLPKTELARPRKIAVEAAR